MTARRAARAITIEIRVGKSPRPVPRERLHRALAAVLADHGREGTLSVAVVSDREIRRLHREFLSVDRATDCLSFDLSGGPEAMRQVGEVVVSGETALRESVRRGIPFERELLLYAVHATLHLVGYDDRTRPQRRAMEARQTEYVDRFTV